jgi:beta-glucosidase/6-phospho-beta-glucosidase/beta-galactosidase
LLQDLPQVLQDKYGGFLTPQIQTDFLYYADTLFKHLGDIVDQWMTFNEVISICELGYQVDVFAPQANKGLGAKYTCGHNVLLAHAKTVQMYRWVLQGRRNDHENVSLLFQAAIAVGGDGQAQHLVESDVCKK